MARAQLTTARTGETLSDVLARIGPAEIAPFLPAGPGFGVRLADGAAAVERLPGTGASFRVGDTGIVAQVAIEYAPDLGAAVQQVTLANEGSEPSPPLRELHAFALPLDVYPRHAPRACGLGGGLTHGYYPPRAYREEEVCFGEARRWEPQAPSFTRWITGRRAYILENEPGGRSSNPYLPLMVTGWAIDDQDDRDDGDGGQVGLWAGLEWSARWELHMGTLTDGRFLFRGGPRVQNLVLQPGETLRLP
ncbi:MAG: hypothetical protein ACRDI2_20690, partial [Chloroflexota bacterium]